MRLKFNSIKLLFSFILLLILSRNTSAQDELINTEFIKTWDYSSTIEWDTLEVDLYTVTKQYVFIAQKKMILPFVFYKKQRPVKLKAGDSLIVKTQIKRVMPKKMSVLINKGVDIFDQAWVTPDFFIAEKINSSIHITIKSADGIDWTPAITYQYKKKQYTSNVKAEPDLVIKIPRKK